MKAEELRIGNYVKIDAGIGKAVSLMSNTFCNECANDDYNITIEMEDGTFREEEDLDFLNEHCPDSLELDHIKVIICSSIDWNYPKKAKSMCLKDKTKVLA